MQGTRCISNVFVANNAGLAWECGSPLAELLKGEGAARAVLGRKRMLPRDAWWGGDSAAVTAPTCK